MPRLSNRDKAFNVHYIRFKKTFPISNIFPLGVQRPAISGINELILRPEKGWLQMTEEFVIGFLIISKRHTRILSKNPMTTATHSNCCNTYKGIATLRSNSKHSSETVTSSLEKFDRNHISECFVKFSGHNVTKIVIIWWAAFDQRRTSAIII